MELTILMPCLYEALTVETCIRKAQTYLAKCGIASTGGSSSLALTARAPGVETPDKHCDAALIGGINGQRQLPSTAGIPPTDEGRGAERHWA
jgi:hypothetical protein